jgi:glycosyltransferase involved in cell wall biosynthesis
MTNKKNICVIVALMITGGSDKLLLSHLSTLIQNGYNVFLYSIHPMDENNLLSNQFTRNGILLKDYSKITKSFLRIIKYAITIPLYTVIYTTNRLNLFRREISKDQVTSAVENKIIFRICVQLLFFRIIFDNFAKKFNIITTYHYSTYGISYNLKKVLKIPVVYTEISSPRWRKGWLSKNKLRKCLNSFNKIFVPSKIIGNELREYEGLINDYIISPFIIEEVPYNFDLKNEKAKSFGVIARLSPEKNQDLLIKVLKIIVKSNPNTQLVLIGKGPEEAKCKSLVKELDLTNNVQFIPRFNEITEVIDNIDIFVLISDVEGMPLTLIEALYYGKPIIVNDVGSTSELVINNFNGFLIDKNDLQSIANKILLIIDNLSIFQEFSINSRKLYGNKYKPKEILHNLLAEYNQLN